MALKRKKKRANGRVNDKQYPKLTLDLVIAGKRVEGLRERTLHDYIMRHESDMKKIAYELANLIECEGALMG